MLRGGETRRRAACSPPLILLGSHPQSVHEFSAQDIDGNTVDLGKYKGTPLIITNVASV